MLRRSSAFVVAVFFACMSLAGCANENAVFRQNELSMSRPMIVTEDAKQRNLIVTPQLEYDDKGKLTKRSWRICAEASPDVFSALSTSAGADLGFGKSATGIDAKAKAAIAISEAAGSIERTQTINLLREPMYRTCERYLSGAINEATFVVQAGRDWRAMIAVLAIEQLTRSARPPSTILVTGGTSTSLGSNSDLAKELAKARGDQRDAEDALAKIKGAAAVDCSTLTGNDQSKCATAKTQATTDESAAEIKLNRANEDVDDIQSVIKAGGGGDQDGSATTAGTSSAGGGGTGGPTGSDLAAVAGVVREIALKALDTNEMQLFCIQKFAAGLPSARSNQQTSLDQGCLTLLAASANIQANQLLEKQQQDAALFQSAQDTDVQRLLAFLKDDTGAAIRWPSLVDSTGVLATNPQLRSRLLATPITLDTIAARYLLLPQDYRAKLIADIGEGQ